MFFNNVTGICDLPFRRGTSQIPAFRMMQLPLILLDTDEEVGPGLEDGVDNLPLASDGVDGYQAALHSQCLDQARDGGNLIRLLRHPHLPQRNAVLSIPGTDHAQRLERTVGTLPGGTVKFLAVYGHHAGIATAYLGYPQEEGFLQAFGRKKGKDAVESIMGGDAVEIRAVRAEERPLTEDKVFNVVSVVGSVYGRGRGHKEDAFQGILLPYVATGILDYHKHA